MTQGIVIDNLSKGFLKSRLALKPFSAQIKPGVITGIVGPDGAGKTTLLRLMATLLKPTTGSITLNGFDTQKDTEQIYSRIGYMPQRFGLYEDLTVLENMRLYADLRDVPKAEMKATFDMFLGFTSLTPFKHRYAGKLSGGMKQKLGLACSLLKDPEILLLDEPSVGVDPISRRDLWAMVQDLCKGGTTVLWSTAYLDEAEKCDEIILMQEGNLLFQGKPTEITSRVKGRVFQTTSRPKDKRHFLQQAIQNPNVVDGVIQGANVRVVLSTDTQVETLGGGQIKWEEIPPVFEDGFLDFLSGDKVRTSKIAEAMDEVPKYDGYAIKATNLVKRFGDFTAVNKVSFAIPPGEIFGFLGPNGAGKSTTFRMLCGLLKTTEGQAEVLGYNMRDSPSLARQQIGYMGQKFSLYGNLTVLQNLTYFSGLYSLKGIRQKEAIAEMIEIFGLQPFTKLLAGGLSLGYKQRLSLACALMHRPKILFLDEPTSGVDPLTRREFWLHINSLVQKGITIMVTTHFIEEAEYCDRICLIYKGTIIAQGTPDELKLLGTKHDDANPTLEDAFINLVQGYDQLIEEQDIG
jgi:ABC-2 type transport system ATP-binding protein